ncbi:MAG: TIGR03618 family F420-dependent PPOX class oxidoreductase [Chloroflexi bacterium]|nr:TIGR03618 family F420-dependent PPOX class oxidoreductase [Chloroflexota bacterium]MYB83403.1 TIGR03618 family F420-dependent PPOX class oxidoreductase [Chloroflexota bacterium]
MELSEALPFIEANHFALVSTVGAAGHAQTTVVSAGLLDGQVAFVSRADTVKVRNVRRSGHCSVTLVNPDNRRYVTVQGAASVHGWDNTDETALLDLLRRAYSAAGRPSDRWDAFDSAMREERRTVVLVTPERVYGSLRQRA